MSEKIIENANKCARNEKKTENGSTIRDRERVNLLQMVSGLETTVTGLKNLVKAKENEIAAKEILIEELRDERKQNMRKISSLESKISNIEVSGATNLTNAIQSAINAVLSSPRFCRLGGRKIGQAISNACWEVRNGIARNQIMKTARSYLRDHVFTPSNILRAMDLAGGVCNLQAYEVIRSVEFVAKDPYGINNKRESVLPHEWRVRHASKKLHQYCDVVIPMKHHITKKW